MSHELLVAPTGWGKTRYWSDPLQQDKKKAIVVYPTISLVNDQYRVLTERGIKCYILKGEASETMLSCQERPFVILACPESLTIESNINLIKNRPPDLFVFDECHLISQWSTFRDSYFKLRDLLDSCPISDVLFLTATLSYDDEYIMKRIIGVSGYTKNVKKQVRDNLTLTSECEDQNILFRKGFWNTLEGSGIIYCTTKRRVGEIYNSLGSKLSAPYTGGTEFGSTSSKEESVRRWINGDLKVVVATSAFGVGINKPDVRFIIHDTPPCCMSDYLQQVGRAGRDGKPSKCIMTFCDPDYRKTAVFLIGNKYPDFRDVNEAFHNLKNRGRLCIDKFGNIESVPKEKKTIYNVLFLVGLATFDNGCIKPSGSMTDEIKDFITTRRKKAFWEFNKMDELFRNNKTINHDEIKLF